jgi:hypothetical protein
VLQVGAEAFELEGGPDGDLVHGGALGGPDGEAVGLEGELVLHAFDGGFIGVEEDLFQRVSQ